MEERDYNPLSNVFYGRQDGTYSLWDHPQFFADPHKPEYYKPLFTYEKIMEEFYKWPEANRELYLTILFVISECICTNEEQIRRYFELRGDSRSQIGQALNFLRKGGFVERYKVGYVDLEAEYEEDRYVDVKAPAPYHLGSAGFILMKHFYSRLNMVKMDTWMTNSRSSMIQRYVAMNEIRVRFCEAQLARKWSWHPSFKITHGQMKLKKPFAVLQIGKKNSNISSHAYLIFERTQASQNFMGYIKDRLGRYEALMDQYGQIPIMNTPNDGEKIVVISCATEAIANELQETLGLQRYNYTIWVMIDEWFDNEGDPESILKALAAPQLNEENATYSLKRMHVTM